MHLQAVVEVDSAEVDPEVALAEVDLEAVSAGVAPEAVSAEAAPEEASAGVASAGVAPEVDSEETVVEEGDLLPRVTCFSFNFYVTCTIYCSPLKHPYGFITCR